MSSFKVKTSVVFRGQVSNVKRNFQSVTLKLFQDNFIETILNCKRRENKAAKKDSGFTCSKI